jgi:hypothetical protein
MQRKSKQDPYLTYVLALGFDSPVELPVKNKGVIRAFRYSGFDPEVTRAALGKAKKHTPEGKFVFVIGRDRAVRIDTATQTILLGDSKRVVDALLRSLS